MGFEWCQETQGEEITSGFAGENKFGMVIAMCALWLMQHDWEKRKGCH
jgi:hypothetical protein